MTLKFFTCSAHPSYGNVQPGGCADVPDHLANALIDGGYAVPVGQRAEVQPMPRENAMLQGGEHAVHGQAQPKKRKAD